MKNLIKPLQLGSLTTPSNIWYAPLAGCSDFPFRMISSLYKPGLMFCEMVKMDALVRFDEGTQTMLSYDPSMRPIGAQLCGSKPALARTSAKMIEDLGFDVVDLNCGCPVDKVTKDGSGSGLLKNPLLIGDIIHEMVSAVSIPVTVKIRVGWDESSIVAKEITQLAELAGAKAITIHGRTRVQAYRGKGNRDLIRDAKQAAKSILVIGNGDIFSPEDAQHMLEYTGCDGVLVARGTMGQPWIAENIRRYFSNEPIFIPQGIDMKECLMTHLNYIFSFSNNKRALLDLRRVGCWYMKFGHGIKKLREGINRASSVEEAMRLIHEYPWDEVEWRAPSLEEDLSCTEC